MYSVYKDTFNLPLVYVGPPTINVQPQGVITSIGEAIILSVSATDIESSQLGYQWMRNGVDLAEETTSTLTISSIASTDIGSYRVKVSNEVGITTSDAASVTLLASNLYTQQQYDAALTSGFNLGVQSVSNTSDSGGPPGTPAATSAILDVYYSTDLTTWDLMKSIEVENPPAGQMFMKTELTPPSE